MIAPKKGWFGKEKADHHQQDVSHKALMSALASERHTETLFSKTCFIARSCYGIRPQDAEDVFHDAVVTYLQIYKRYPAKDNHFGLLVGIFHKKCLEFLDSRDRRGRIARRFTAKLQADRPAIARGEDPCGTTIDRVLRDEDARLIREVITAIEPGKLEVLLTLAEGRKTRIELIEEQGVNRNTFDTRLRKTRLELQGSLTSIGVL